MHHGAGVDEGGGGNVSRADGASQSMRAEVSSGANRADGRANTANRADGATRAMAGVVALGDGGVEAGRVDVEAGGGVGAGQGGHQAQGGR